MFSNAIKAIIDLLKLRKDVKKTDLEIEKLKREQENAESIIKPISFQDIERFDPKLRKLYDILSKAPGPRKRHSYGMLIFLVMSFLWMLFLIVWLYKRFA